MWGYVCACAWHTQQSSHCLHHCGFLFLSLYWKREGKLERERERDKYRKLLLYMYGTSRACKTAFGQSLCDDWWFKMLKTSFQKPAYSLQIHLPSVTTPPSSTHRDTHTVIASLCRCRLRPTAILYSRGSIKPLQSETIQMQMLQFTKLLPQITNQLYCRFYFLPCWPTHPLVHFVLVCMYVCVCVHVAFFVWCAISISFRFVLWCFVCERHFCIVNALSVHLQIWIWKKRKTSTLLSLSFSPHQFLSSKAAMNARDAKEQKTKKKL